MAATVVTTSALKIPAGTAEVRRPDRSRVFPIARWGFVGILMVAPLAFGAVLPWAWAGLLILACILLLLWTVGNIQRCELRIYGSPLYLLGAIFFALGLAQLFSGATLDRHATRESMLVLAIVLLVFFLAGQLFAIAAKDAWRKMGLAVAIFACGLSFFAIIQFLSSLNLIYWSVRNHGWPFGPYVNHNDYAGLMEMLIPIAAAYVFSRPRTDPRRLLLAFGLSVPLASVLLSGSRGGCIALLAEALVLGLILWRTSSSFRRRRLAAALAMGLAVPAILFFWMAPNRIVERLGGLTNLTRTTEVTLGQRELATLDTMRIFRSHPWLGTGLGSFETVFPQYRTFATDLGWAHAHDDYAEALAETGITGGVLMALALAIFFKSAFSNLTNRLQHETGWIQLGAALGCCGLLVHSFVDFNLHIPANAAWFAACVALATAPCPLAGTKPFAAGRPAESEGDG